jgi:GntR family transcriptional regulator
MADGEPLLLEQVFLPEARFPGLLAGDLEGGSLYELLGERYDTRVVRARESLEPIAMPPREAQLLGVDAHRPALRIEGLAYDRSGRPVEFARSYVRGDRTRYYVERVVVRSSPRSDETDDGARSAAFAATRPT